MVIARGGVVVGWKAARKRKKPPFTQLAYISAPIINLFNTLVEKN
jgi:hypothetical protein